MGGINENQDRGENGKGIQPFFNGGDFRTFGGGREGNSQPLSPNFEGGAGSYEPLQGGKRWGGELQSPHTHCDGSCHGLCQVTSQ